MAASTAFGGVLFWLLICSPSAATFPYLVDDSLGLGREFDGIGGISGGGATSKMLMGYPEPQRSQILDYLFKPNFGASLHIFKVEIGGDSNSAEGVEASHMRTGDDENYHRGYEWWMMKEAKKRNPDIKLYGLPWVFPGWLGQGYFTPYINRTNLVRYITNWIHGAAKVHNLTINYIGIWNERPYDVTYIKMLRKALDNQGLSHVRIVGADREWDFLPDMLKDRELADSVDIIGVHYPATYSPPEALKTDRKLWASEEYSIYNDDRGGACWARVLNEGYVNGHLTSNIAWNIIASYYEQLPYPRNGLMTAEQTWSGHYEVNSPIWITAHHTQFMKPGWRYLLHQYGVGHLSGNGTYVALTSPDSKHLTLIIETMNPKEVPCFYPMPKYEVRKKQTATFKLRGTYSKIKSLNVWYSAFHFGGKNSTIFQRLNAINVVDGEFSLDLDVNVVYTLTTLDVGKKGNHGTPPKSAPFPTVYHEDFEAYEEYAEPNNFAQQNGAYEVHKTNDSQHGKVLVQLVPEPGLDTCRPERLIKPINIIGNYYTKDVSVQCDMMVPSLPGGASGVLLALRVDRGGCDTNNANGLFLWLFPATNTFIVSGNFRRTKVYKNGFFKMERDQWITVSMQAKNDRGYGFINNEPVFGVDNLTSVRGFSALGTEDFGIAYFDNFHMNITKTGERLSDGNSGFERSNLRYAVNDGNNRRRPLPFNRQFPSDYSRGHL